jgi:4-coumarate--CoA ligase
MLSPLHRGVITYIMQGFNLPQFCRIVEHEKITVAYIVPPVALALAKAPVVSNFNLSSLRFMHSSAAPTSKEIIVAVNDRLSVPIRQGYGLSEAAPGVCSQRSAEWNAPIGTSGRLVPSMAAKFVLEDGKEAPPGSEGEICLKGPNIFKGYYSNSKATADAFDSEGWYHTGDVGLADEQGNIYITDRLKDLIKYNGFQVAPAQLEDILLGHPAVADVTVIGVYSEERATELPRAYVVVAAGHTGDEKLAEVLQEWLNERVSPHKKLRGGVRFVEAIPKSNAGKILRRVLVEQARSEEKRGSPVKARL